MFYCVFFDISNDKTRRLAVKLLKQTELVRVQRSVFLRESGRPFIRAMEDQMWKRRWRMCKTEKRKDDSP